MGFKVVCKLLTSASSAPGGARSIAVRGGEVGVGVWEGKGVRVAGRLGEGVRVGGLKGEISPQEEKNKPRHTSKMAYIV
jgi:hypothetical protein